MKITCSKCAADYEVQDSLIPPSGLMMRCPACLHTFPVRPVGPAIILQDEEFTPPGGVRAPSRPPDGDAAAAAREALAATLMAPPGHAQVPPSRSDTHADAELPMPKRGGGRP